MAKKHVLIVESPTKARTLSGYLGRGYEVCSSKGHVRDLPAREFGVDVRRDFAPTWEVRDRKLVSALKKAVADADRVYLATDPDREGEAIAYDIAELLGDADGERFGRVLLHEITAEAVRRALGQAGKIDPHKVEAQRTRRILDRLMGYEVSPVMSRVLAGRKFEGLSAGRVQSVALRFLCDREREIHAFVPQTYWQVELAFPTKPPFTAAFPDRVTEASLLEKMRAALAEERCVVTDVTEEEVKRRPSPPFITSTLQQTASSELGLSPRRTMQLAQELYEGVEIDGQSVGLITYMRTDSVRVSEGAVSEARAHVRSTLGKEYLSPRPRVHKNKRRTQDAHEAIRPTSVEQTPEQVAHHLRADQRKLYELIWRRFVATQMADGLWTRRKVEIRAGDLAFRASSSRPSFLGFARLYPVAELEDEQRPLPEDLSPGMELPAPELHTEEKQTEPPGRYTEAGLVRKLEREGIGRPSTYAAIVSVIQERGYVRRDGGSLKPTLLGQLVSEFLAAHFPETVEQGFTAWMEEELDRIQEGEAERLEVLRAFYERLHKRLEAVERLLSRGERFQLLSDVSCPACNAPMTVRVWKGSLYLGCSRYPECRTTRSIPPDIAYTWTEDRVELARALEQAAEAPDAPCPQCGTPMLLRHGRFGRYMACPSCRQTAPVSTGVTCPSCQEGEMVERFAQKRGTFYACNRYPDCRFRVSGRPIESCPECKEGVRYEDPRQGVRCSNKHCPS